jgi:tRNA A58 N-methylase Trm61
MIAHFRHRVGQREAIAAPGDAASLSAVYTPTQQTWGKVTSKRPDPLSPADIALMAFRTGVKPAILRRAIELGLFK